MCNRQFRMTVIDAKRNEQVSQPVIMPAPLHAGDLLYYDGGLWQVSYAEFELPAPGETTEQAREPIEVTLAVSSEITHTQL